MYYKIVEKFGPDEGARWKDYLRWRGLQLTRFDSVDGPLRGNLFSPESEDDWNNYIQEDFKVCLITNLEYAKKIQQLHEHSEIVGIDFPMDSNYRTMAGCLGFDILDSHWDVSLLTDWGTDEERIFSDEIMENGLMNDLTRAFQIRDVLRTRFPDDHHARDCDVCAVYRV